MNIRDVSKRFILPLALLVGGTALAPGRADAFVCATCATEWTQLANNFQLAWQYAKQIQQYQQQISQYQLQIQQYRQMNLRGLVYRATPGFREHIDARFPARDLNAGVAETCGTVAKAHPAAREQQVLCINRVQTENRKFNVMRELLRNVAQNDADLAAASAERASLTDDEQGALQANSNKIAAINTKMQNDLQNAKYTMDAYDAALAALNAQTVNKAKSALTDSNSLLNRAAQGVILHTALRAARLRDR